MEVILKEDVPQLGHRGDVVKVAEGYGRNYLLPRKLAILATSANKAVIDQMKAAAVRRTAKEKSDAEQLAKQFDGLSLHFTRRAGENDQLFGSVTASDIAHELENRGFNVDRRKIEIGHAMKNVGEYTIHIKLHREVAVPIKVTVTKEVETAQA